jgi:Niemann-Pick C1 protein
MISAEVVPFLVLAIGVDNMFLISRAERSVPAHITEIELRIAYGMKEIGPSIFTAAFCEALAFFIGMLTDVPALYSFCLVAGIAVLVDFILQMTLFIPALTLDGKRIQQKKADVFFCVKYPNSKTPRKEVIRSLFAKHFIPFVFNKWTEILVFATTIVLFSIGVCSTLKLGLGLNQNVSLIEGSDTFDYFDTLFDIAEAGPPAYLVFNNVNYTIPENLDAMS